MRMMQWTLRSTLCLAVLAAILPNVYAGKLRQMDLPPDAELVIHLDWDAARTGAPFRELADKVISGLATTNFIGADAAELVSDARLHDMTLVVTGSGETFQIVRADVEVTELQRIFADAKGYVVVQHGEHAIHHWLDLPESLKSETAKSDAEEEPSPIYAAICGEGNFIVSKQLRTVVNTLNRIDSAEQAISDDAFAAINKDAPENTVLLVHAGSMHALEPVVSGLPVKTGRAYLSVEGSVCEMTCVAEMNNAILAAAIADTLKTDNLVFLLQSYLQNKVAAEATPTANDQDAQEEKPNDGKRTLNLGFGFKNVDAETMHAMLSQAFSTTTEGAEIRIFFRGVVEPTVDISSKGLSIQLQLDGAKTSTAAKEETIR